VGGTWGVVSPGAASGDHPPRCVVTGTMIYCGRVVVVVGRVLFHDFFPFEESEMLVKK
jgi:hypothetical protein